MKKIYASSGNRTRAARVAGEHSTTEPTMRSYQSPLNSKVWIIQHCKLVLAGLKRLSVFCPFIVKGVEGCTTRYKSSYIDIKVEFSIYVCKCQQNHIIIRAATGDFRHVGQPFHKHCHHRFATVDTTFYFAKSRQGSILCCLTPGCGFDL